MNSFRRISSILVFLVLTACSSNLAPAPVAVPEPAVAESTQGKAPALEQPLAKPGTLAGSVPVAEWKESLESQQKAPVYPGGHQLIPVDPASGQALPGYEPIVLGQAITHAFSPDGNTLAVVGFDSSENPRGGRLHLIDLSTWESQVQELDLAGYVNAIAYSPDGERLAISHGNGVSQILLLDVSKPHIKSKSAARQSSLTFLVYKLKFSSDGSGLMVYGSEVENRYTVSEMSPNPPIVTMLDSADLSARWEASLEGVRHGVVPKDGNGDSSSDLHQPGQAIYLFPGLVFAPDQDILYVVHPDEDKLTTVDFHTQNVITAEIKPKLSWIERLLSLTTAVAHAKIAEGTSKHVAISLDGKLLYIIGQQNDLIEDKNGNWEMIENPLGLQIVRTEDGSRLAQHDSEASELSISPDGQFLYLRGWENSGTSAWTQVFDTSTSQVTARMDGMWLVPTRRVNGASILGSSVWINDKREHHNAIVDSQSVLAEWVSPEYLAWLTLP